MRTLPVLAPCTHLEAQVALEVRRDLAHEALEGQLAAEHHGRFLQAAHLLQRTLAGARAVPVVEGWGGIRRTRAASVCCSDFSTHALRGFFVPLVSLAAFLPVVSAGSRLRGALEIGGGGEA